MHFRNICSLLVLGRVAIAAPEPASELLQHDELVLFNNEGSYSVIKEAQFQSLIDKGDIAPPPTRTVHVQPQRRKAGGKDKRQEDCERSSEVQIMSERQFLGPDVAMSPVVAALAATATANVMQGYSIQNFLTFGARGQGSVGIIAAAFDISYSRVWTSTQQITFLFQVPAGNYGVVVSEPWTRRIEGFVLTGCTDKPDNISFLSDTYTDKTFGMLSWVDGVIRLCLSHSYPVPFCLGSGHHY